VIPLSDTPKWVVKAGVDYANGGWNGSKDVTIQKQNGRIMISWTDYVKDGESIDSEPDNLHGVDVENKEVEGTPKAFKKELSERD